MEQGIGIKLKRRRETLDNVDSGKFLGDPVLPSGGRWDRILGEDEVFLCQLRLEELAELDSQRLLPRSGWLWFFVDMDAYPYTPRVLFAEEEPDEVQEDFNELWVPDTKRSFGVSFTRICTGCQAVLLGSCTQEEVELLRVDPKAAGLGIFTGIGGSLRFMIRRADLAEKTFASVWLEILPTGE